MAALDAAVSALSDLHVQSSFAIERIRAALTRARLGETAKDTEWPSMDQSRFAVLWHGRTCRLGQTVLYRLFEKLLRRHDNFVSSDQLLQDVWTGDVRSPHTVRSSIRHLRNALRQAHMASLARRIRAAGKYYGLILHD